MGDDQPRPGIDTAQPTFFVADQDTGSDDASAIPALLAPRNCGQSVGPAARGTVRPAAATRITKIGKRLVIAVLDEREALGLPAVFGLGFSLPAFGTSNLLLTFDFCLLTSDF